MSNLQLHLKLDEIVAGEFIDYSDYGQKTTIQGTVTVVDDDEFTHVASFAGVNPSIRLPEVGKLLEEKSFTLETWVKIPSNAPSSLLPILTTEDSDPNNSLAIGLINGDRTHPGFHPFIGNPNPQTATDDSLLADQWYHLAFVYDYGSNASGTNAIQKIFVNGHLASSSNHPAFEGVGELRIGGGNQDNHLHLSNLRIYSGALSELDIQHDMYQDRPHFAFQEMYPLDFSLRDPDKQESLYLLDEGKDLVYTLEIRNTSKEVIHLKEREAEEEFYHFALRFRPGVLAADSLSSTDPNSIKITESNQDNWDIHYSSTATRNSQDDTLYFSWKGAVKSLSPNERLDITLENLRVDVTGGSRGTRIELLTDNLYFHSEGNEKIQNEKIQIVRENHINIISHRGQKNIPLHVGFIGSNTVINNGEENNLTLRITNLQKNKPIKFTTNPLSQISISFDVDSTGNTGEEEFALGSANEVKNGIHIPPPMGWQPGPENPPKGGEIPVWKFQPQDSIVLGAEQHIAFDISPIVTNYPTGQTYLKVSYQNIPGYWDGHFVVPIEKQPLIMREDRVGIGTNHPATVLDVIAHETKSIYHNGIRLHSKNPDIPAIISTSVPGAGEGDPLISFNVDGAGGWSIGVDNSDRQKLKIGGDFDSLTKHTRLTIDRGTGNVGIGTNNPTVELDVAGKVQAHQISINNPQPTSVLDVVAHETKSIYHNGIRLHSKNPDIPAIISTSVPGAGEGDPLISFNVDGAGGWSIGVDNSDRQKLKIGGDFDSLTKHTRLTIDRGTGNVGIGTNEPHAPLSIETENGKEENPDKAMHITNDCILFGGNNNGKQSNSASISAGKFSPNSLNIVGMSSGKKYTERRVDVWAEAGFIIRGNVGIGTMDPRAPLHVIGFNQVKAYWDDYLDPYGVHDAPSNNTEEKVSILANYVIASPRIRSYHFGTASDRRIKKVLNRSNGESDLELVNQLTVMDYQYVDVVTNGDAIRKGLIAQEVEKMYPGAVTNASEFVPDVYELSDTTIYSETTSQLTICLKKAHHLEEGDEVRLIGKNGPKEVKVIKMVSDTEFIVANWDKENLYENGQLFVYGKKVNDFKTVNYQELSVIGISATQELHKRLEAQEKEIKELKDLVATQASQIEQLLKLCNQGLSKE